MAIVSMRSKKRILEISISALLCSTAYLMQNLVLNQFGIHGSTCNLPLTLTIVWGLVFGSSMPTLTNTELRRRSLGEIFSRQLASGSHSGFLIGWFFSFLYFSVIPVYPLSFPLIGWTAGYFCLRGLGQGNLLAIPMTFILTIFAEGVMSWELYAMGRSGVFEHLNAFILPEALLNAIVAPFIYFPMRRWYDLVEGQQSSFPID
ncbi:MAG: hypothetical protein K2X27_26420 [Candidatus Obscuribacterales bacterium]|nr:hypothetical protein [Candidatus Obscuribacterales bacterium]